MGDISKTDFWSYAVKWGTDDLGFIKEVDPTGLKMIWKELTIGNIGPAVLDKQFQGLTGEVKFALHEVKIATIQKLCPWWTSGSVPITPTTIGWSQYANSKLLNLHPYTVAAGTTTEDRNYLKVFLEFTDPKAEGNTWRQVDVTATLFPDQALLPALTYGYRGPVPS